MVLKVTVETNSKSARVTELDRKGKLQNSWVVEPDSSMVFLVEGREQLKVSEEGRES